MDRATIVKTGEDQAITNAKQQEERDRHWDESNRSHTFSWFYQTFYESHYKINPEWTAYSGKPKYIHDPPLPLIEDWITLQPGNSRGNSRFTCEDINYEVEWKYEGGGDRAYWDDGWWPNWYIIKKGFLWRKNRIGVWGPESVAKALN